MAIKYNLKILLCLHGAPGSQNGRDHSGQVGEARWYRDATLRSDTIRHLEELAYRYRNSPALWGIELLNEPKVGLLQRRLRRFYRESYESLRTIVPRNIHIVFHDAFTPRLLSGALPAHRQPVVMDIHWYHFISLFARLPLGWYFALLRYRGYLLRQLRQRQMVIVGEWSGVIAHKKLHSYPPKKRHALTQKHLKLQLQSYRHGDGWFYWSYKTEGGGAWSFRNLVDSGELSIE